MRFALLQGDDEELPLAEQTNQPLTDTHLELAEQLDGKYDLIVFPESALDTDPQIDPSLGARAHRHRGRARHERARERSHACGRTASSTTRTSCTSPTAQLQGIYSKQHLVPFGEYVPWRGALGFIGELRQIPYDFDPGDERVLFRVGGHDVGSVICFESAFAPLVRDYVRDGAEAIVVSTNNRSYRRSGNSEQHLALSQMRAAETGRPVLQASVSGISGVIDPDGSVHDTTGLFEQAIVQGRRCRRSTGETLYVRFGDWVVLLSRAGVVGGDGVRDPSARCAGRHVASSLTAATSADDDDQPRAARGRGQPAAEVRAELRADDGADRDEAATVHTTSARTRTAIAATPLAMSASTFFTPLSRCRSSAMKMPSSASRITPCAAPK